MSMFRSILSVLMACCVLLSCNSPLVNAQEAAAQRHVQQQSQQQQQQSEQHQRRELQSNQAALDAAKAKWNSFAINEYIYHVRTSDFFYDVTFACRVTSNVVRDIDTTLEVTSNSTLNLPNLSPPTVLGFFDDIQKAIRSNKNPTISVAYDATYGYPKVVNLDYGQAAPGFFFLTDTIRATVDTLIPVTLEAKRLNDARARHNNFPYDSWDMTYQQGQNYRVQVRSKVVTSVRDEANADVTAAFNGNSVLRNRLTILNSYTEVRTIFDQKKPKTLSVAYHPTKGYITSLSATFASFTNDGGNIAYSILQLTEVGTPKPVAPTGLPSRSPSDPPTRTPTRKPTGRPTKSPTGLPTKSPTGRPTPPPTPLPTPPPTERPTKSPSAAPSFNPTKTACVPRFAICDPGVSECCNSSDRCGTSNVCRPLIGTQKDGREKLSRDRAFTGIPSRNGRRRELQLIRGM